MCWKGGGVIVDEVQAYGVVLVLGSGAVYGPTCSSGKAQEALIISHTGTRGERGALGEGLFCVGACLYVCVQVSVKMKHMVHNMLKNRG